MYNPEGYEDFFSKSKPVSTKDLEEFEAIAKQIKELENSVSHISESIKAQIERALLYCSLSGKKDLQDYYVHFVGSYDVREWFECSLYGSSFQIIVEDYEGNDEDEYFLDRGFVLFSDFNKLYSQWIESKERAKQEEIEKAEKDSLAARKELYLKLKKEFE